MRAAFTAEVDAALRDFPVLALPTMADAPPLLEVAADTSKLVGMTSLGSSCLSYMKVLKPELERRGYDVAVFHSTGMGGRAYEAVAAQGGFAVVFDFCI